MNKKISLLILSTILIIGAGVFYYMTQYKKGVAPKKEVAQKATPINYKGAMVINKVTSISEVMGELNKEAPASGGTFDLKTMAKTITAEALKAFSDSKEKSLPLVASWNTGIPTYIKALDPMYMISRIENGEHILVSWKLDPYYDETIGYDYYEESIKKAAELGLPLVFVLPAPESALSSDSVYAGMDAKENPNVVNTKGEILNKLSPFGPNTNWEDVGEMWASSDLMTQIQEWYPNPPLVVFVSENRSDKLTWKEIETDTRYTLTGKDDNYKRTLINAKWVEKYRQMHEGFKAAFTKTAWKENVKFITRDELSMDMGANKNWIDDATVTNLYANIWPLTADGVNVDFNLQGTDTSIDGPHVLVNNLPFMLNEAKTINPLSASQLSINADSIVDNPARYRGLTQFALWFLRPNFVRQDSALTQREELQKAFQEVSDSVELIHYNSQLTDFWRNGTLVKSGTSNLNTDIPTQYENDPRWFLLDTDANPKRPWTSDTAINVWAFALVEGEAPNREWLLYVQSPDGNKTDVTVTVPGYKDVLVDASAMGSFYNLHENTNIAQNKAIQKITSKAIKLAPVVNLYVSTTGSNDASGTISDPFKTLEEARNTARTLKNNSVKVWLRGGVYTLEKTFELTSIDSRTEETPLIFSGWKDENITLLGSVLVKNWRNVTNTDEVYNLLTEKAKKNTLVSNLSNIGITELTKAIASTFDYDKGGNPIYSNELFTGNSRANITRYPKEKLINFTYDGTTLHFNNNSTEVKNIINSWSADKNIYTYGRWNYDWADERNKVVSINKENSSINLNSEHHYGYRKDSTTRKGIGFYAFNIASSLEESTYYIDYINNKLYYWPKQFLDKNTYFSNLDTIVSIKDASYITLSNISLEQSKRNAINSEGGSNINIINCNISNTGGTGIYIYHTINSKISSCVVKDTGGAGIQVNGGDRPTLTNGNIVIENNEVYDTSKIVLYYTAGIKIYGVGNKVINNHIYHLPHTAIYFNGNNHIIENNIIHDVVLKANDAGAIYAGQDWSQRGTVIQDNLIYNVIGEGSYKGARGIYLDDLLCGTTIKNNILYNVNQGIQIGGGRDNIVDGNIIAKYGLGIRVDARGVGKYDSDEKAKLHMGGKMNKLPWKSTLWKNHYPNLYTIYDNSPRLPLGNKITNNTFISPHGWKDFRTDSEKYLYLKNNTHIEELVNDISSYKNIDEFKTYLRNLK